MRNLYSRLNISSSASPEEIQSAIKTCSNASIRADASEVLLTPGRRRIYDGLNSALIDIGHLRAVLGLSHAENWHGEEASEYTQKSSTPHSKRDELLKKIQASNRQVKSQGFVNPVKNFFLGLFRLVAVIVVIGSIIGFISVIFDDSPSSSKPKSRYSQSSPPKPVFTEPALPLPYSGATRMHTSARAVAPLEIKTSAGSNYLVKLQNNSTGKNIMDIFVRGGNTVEVNVPLGSYTVKYASGSTWYGYKHYFGPETGYNKADSIFHFRNNGYQISGYTITLYRVAHGNLSTSRINPTEF